MFAFIGECLLLFVVFMGGAVCSLYGAYEKVKERLGAEKAK